MMMISSARQVAHVGVVFSLWCLVAGGLCIAQDTAISSPERTWSSLDGKYRVTAKLVGKQDDDTLILEKPDGTRINVSVAKLSAADQEFVLELDAKPPVPTEVAGKELDAVALVKSFDRPRPKWPIETLLEWPRATNTIASATISADGRHVARALSDNQRYVCQAWNLATNEAYPDCEIKFDLKGGRVQAMHITADGKYCLIGGDFKQVHVWELATGKVVHSHDAAASVNQITQSLDGKTIYYSDSDAAVYQFPLLGGAGAILKGEGNLSFTSLTPVRFERVLDAELLLATLRENSLAMLLMFPAAKNDPQPSPPRGSSLKLYERGTRCAVGDDRLLAFGVKFSRLVVYTQDDAGDTNTLTLKTRCVSPDTIALMDNGRFVVTANFRVVVKGLDYNLEDELEIRGSSQSRLTPDGRHFFAQGFSSDPDRVYKIGNLVDCPLIGFHDLARDLLLKKQFAELDAIWQTCLDNDSPFPWTSGVMPHETRFDGGTKSDYLLLCLQHRPLQPDKKTEHRERIEQWAKARPKSEIAQLLWARQLVLEGWAIRGGAPAAMVPRANAEAFARLAQQADAIIQPIIAREKPHPAALEVYFDIARALGKIRDDVQPAIEQLLAVRPDYVPGHIAVATLCMPRWGGEPTDAAEYAALVADKIGGGDGDAVYARIALAHSKHARQADMWGVLGFDFDRVIRGADHITKNSEEGDFAGANIGLYFAHLRKDKEQLKRYAVDLDASGNSEGRWDVQVFDDYDLYAEAIYRATQALK